VSWEGCKGWLDPAWKPQDNQDSITSASPETDDPAVIPTPAKETKK